jgi:hypothetical protein
MRWTSGPAGYEPEFRLYCRIKPFSYVPRSSFSENNVVFDSMRSMFQNVFSHVLDKEAVVSINAGINWADRFNFLEIKPDWNDNALHGAMQNKAQAFQGDNKSSAIYSREGFRPMIFSIRQLPFKTEVTRFETNVLEQWTLLAKEWYFDCHKFLNGTVTLYGSDEYIPVGDNIMFDAELIGVTRNYNSEAKDKEAIFVLAHVESVQNNFSVSANGERSFQTTINFVRGILVDKSKQLIGSGTIDNLASKLSKDDSKNSATVFSSGEE